MSTPILPVGSASTLDYTVFTEEDVDPLPAAETRSHLVCPVPLEGGDLESSAVKADPPLDPTLEGVDPGLLAAINSTEEVPVDEADYLRAFIAASDEDNRIASGYDIYVESVDDHPSRDGGGTPKAAQKTPGAPQLAADNPPLETDEPVGAIDPKLTLVNLVTLPVAELSQRGMVDHHLSSMNTFLREGMEQIVKSLYSLTIYIQNARTKTIEDQSIEAINITVRFSDVHVGMPTTYTKNGAAQRLTPALARIAQETLRNPVNVTVKVTATATTKEGDTIVREAEVPNMFVGCIPTLVKSQGCYTGLADRETLKLMEEDPRDPGGYGIFSGLERAFDSPENITNNMPHIHKVAYKNEVCRVDFISKPGDSFENSARCLIRLYNNGSITVELTTGKFEKLEIPFYVMFRALGMTSDLDIADSIMFGVNRDDRVSCLMREALERAFNAPDETFAPIRKTTVPTAVVQFLAQCIVKLSNPSAARKEDEILKYLNASVLDMIDKYFFPHIGLAGKNRIKKLRYFGFLIHKMLLVHFGIVEPTNRDDYDGKRVLPAGIAMAKSVKQQWNFAVGQPIKQGLIKAFKGSPFSEVKLASTITDSVNSEDLLDLLTRSVVSGTGEVTIKRRVVRSHISSQHMIRKNDVAVFSVLRSFTITNLGVSKQTERAEAMRGVVPSHELFIDTAQSPETVMVGTVKQEGIACSISEACSSSVLKDTLARDPDIIPFDDVVPSEVYARQLSIVFVQGDMVGYTDNTARVRDKYTRLRRQGDPGVNRRVTIAWSPTVREIHFWTDVGRPMVPLVIVYNNLAAYKRARLAGRPIEFCQWIRLTIDHINDLQHKRTTMKDLEAAGVIEYIAPSEVRNAYVALNINVLRDAAHDVCNRYTHMGIEQAALGIVSLCSPFNTHASATRNTYFTCQRKSGLGWPCLNFPFRNDKLVPFQHTPQKPLVSTIADAFVLPAGHVAMCVLALGDGSTQEDSLGLNQNSVDTGMLHASLYSCEKIELESGEILGNPHPTKTLDVKKNADFSDLVDGKFIRVGAKVREGTVLVSKVAKIPGASGPKSTEEFLYTDRSAVYKKKETVYVERVIPLPSADNATKILIKTREDKPFSRGDKGFSRTGNKGIGSSLRPRIDLPFSARGVTPDIICSIHSMPTRMALNQKSEMKVGQDALRRGIYYDATAFCPSPSMEFLAQDSPADLEAFINGAETTFKGCTRMFNGVTGLWYDALLFMGPTVYIRHNKFIDDNKYAILSGPPDPLTRQARDGKSNQGGIKFGEMEKNAKAIHGGMGSLCEKIYTNADGCELHMCAVCGDMAVVNHKSSLYYCRKCDDAADIRTVDSCWASNLFMAEVAAMGVKQTFELTKHTWGVADGASRVTDGAARATAEGVGRPSTAVSPRGSV